MTLITVWPLKRKVFAIIEWPQRQLWDADERRRGMLGQLLALQSKMCSLSLSLPPPLSGFLPVSLCELWVGERLYPRRSAGGNTNKHHRLLPLCGSVLCWRDGFVPSQRVCQLCSLVCVWVFIWVAQRHWQREHQTSATLCTAHHSFHPFWSRFFRSLQTPVVLAACVCASWPYIC